MCDCDGEKGEFFMEDFVEARRIVTCAILFQRDHDHLAVGQLFDGALAGLVPSSRERRERFLMMMVSLVVSKLGSLTDDDTAALLGEWLLRESVSSD